MENRLEDFFEETRKFYRRPIPKFSKTMVRRYDKYLIDKGLIQKEIRVKDQVGKTIVMPAYPPPPRKNLLFKEPKNIAFIHEDIGHITGGRYYTYFIISALLELGHKVTVYSNRRAVFSHEFDFYKKPEFKIVSQTASQLATAKIPKSDLYIGSPIHGAMSAIKQGQRYNKPALALIFDPFPMMDKYIGKRNYVGWEKLVKDLKNTDTEIISLCNETSKYIYSWLNKKQDQVHPVYPCINSKILEGVENYKRKNHALFISRLVKHKRFEDVVIACKNANIKLKVIASVNGIEAQKIVKKHNMQNNVVFHLRVADEEKFKMIKQAGVVINGSVFEGFGMYLAEAIACGTPFVGYDYPTFNEIRDYAKATNVYLARSKDVDDLSRQLSLAIKEQNFTNPNDAFEFEKMIERLKDI
jgi:glycosyltransferase involved in cell wall biosynthesis